MKILTMPQGSTEWLQARCGVVTASEMDALVSPKFKIREGAGVETYLFQKLAEWWTGAPLASAFSSFAPEQGQLLEQEARGWLGLQLGEEIQQVGLCLSDCGRYGCSPDGLLAHAGAEIKCPQPLNHTRYLLDGGMPAEYLVQVHFSLFVTGFPSWHFLSYRRRFPPLHLEVKRDEGIQSVLSEALEKFLVRFEAGKARLIELNGGEQPYRHQPATDEQWENAGRVQAQPREEDFSLWPKAPLGR